MAKFQHFDAIIIGAGAAGLMCAATAGQNGRRVLLLDHASEPGKKILISGGGRCNFTNLDTPAERYLSNNPHFAKSALKRYSPQNFIDLIEGHDIAWHEKTLGQLFCDGSARQVVGMLMDECNKGAVKFSFGTGISELNYADGLFSIKHGTNHATAPALILASGGLSIPKMGATGFAYDVARKFRLGVVEPRPGLVPLKLGPQEALFQSLSGISCDIEVRCGDTCFREAALLTHKGLSGPAILQISSYWKPGEEVSINFFPDNSKGWLTEQKHARPKAHIQSVLAHTLSSRLSDALAQRLSLVQQLANLSDLDLKMAESKLSNWTMMPTGTEGFAKAEVTAGGIDTSELSSKTMQAHKMPGLYAIGEAVDVTGWLGGYNFQWAWSSGWACGQAL